MTWDFMPIFNSEIAVVLAAVLVALGIVRMLREGRSLSFGRGSVPTLLRLLVITGLILVSFNPVAIAPRKSEGRQKLALLLDGSASMATRDVGDNLSRFESALSTLQDPKVLNALKSEFDLDIRLFHKETVPANLKDLDSGDAKGSATDIGKALMETIEDLHASSAKGGILLISDGRATIGNTSEASQLALARSVPLWTWCLGGKVPYQDVWVETGASEVLAFGGAEVELSAEIHRSGYSHRSFRVHLVKEGVVQDSSEVVPDAEGRGRVSFRLTAPEKGEHRYTFRVEPQEGEADTLNNERSVFLRVVGEKVRVLLVEGQPHWDTKFLVQTLKRHERVDLTAIYRLGPNRYSAVVSQQGKFRREEANLFPKTSEELSHYDICIFGRNCESFFTDETERMLTDFVAKQGGGIAFARGKPYSGRFYPLAKLEPVVWGDSVEERVHPRITEAGRENPVFDLGSRSPSGKSVHELFDRAPALDQAMTTRGVKPLAVALAHSGTDPKGDQGNILMAFQRYGLGKVVLLNMTGIWRWAFREKASSDEEEHLYARFWVSLLQWMLSGADFLPGADVALRSNQRCYTDEQQMQFQIMTRGIEPTSYKPRLTLSGSGVAEDIEPVQGQGGVYAASFGPFKPGVYEIVLHNNVGRPSELKTQVEVVHSSIEMRDLSADPDTMKKIAQETGGRPLSGEDIAGLPEIVRDLQAKRQLLNEKKTLWDRWWVLLLILMALGLEWYLRRRQGLL